MTWLSNRVMEGMAKDILTFFIFICTQSQLDYAVLWAKFCTGMRFGTLPSMHSNKVCWPGNSRKALKPGEHININKPWRWFTNERQQGKVALLSWRISNPLYNTRNTLRRTRVITCYRSCWALRWLTPPFSVIARGHGFFVYSSVCKGGHLYPFARAVCQMALSTFRVTKENTFIWDLITIICLIKWEFATWILHEHVSL